MKIGDIVERNGKKWKVTKLHYYGYDSIPVSENKKKEPSTDKTPKQIADEAIKRHKK